MPFEVSFRSLGLWFKASDCMFWTAQAGNLAWSNHTSCGTSIILNHRQGDQPSKAYPERTQSIHLGLLVATWNPRTGDLCLQEHLHESKQILNFKSATKNG